MRKKLLIAGCVLGSFALAEAQQAIQVEVYPRTSRAIGGQLNLDRKKYFNLSGNGTGIEGKIGDQARIDYYFKDLKMTLGRDLGMVGSEVQWGNSIFEDPERPGYTDIDRLLAELNPSNSGASADFMATLGDNQDVANHDRHNSYPEFMDLYTAEGSDQSYPGNTDAAAELAATLLEYRFTDWTRPAFYEPVNEPDWRYWGDTRFIEHHTSIHEKVQAASLPVEVGGPCLSVGYFYKNNFQSLSSITKFIDKTQFGLDFYSYHIYNYMHWDQDLFDFAGSISTGLPTEGVFDAIANHTVNKFGSEFTYVASEHGGYISDGSQETVANMLANKYFPGSGFAHEMEKRSIEDFLAVSSSMANTFTYMNHPHIVKKAVPFILLEAAGWDPTYDAVLLVKEDFDKNSSTWWESKRIHFYEFFRDVQGRRILSFCDDTDIQHHAFVDGNKLILLFNNQANLDGHIDLQIHDDLGEVKEIRARKFGRKMDFRPYLTEERLFTLTEPLAIKSREAIALFIEYSAPVQEDRILNEVTHYGDKTSVEFSGSQDFTIDMPDYEQAAYAILRVGIGLTPASSKNVNFSINGTALESYVEDCADRLSGGSDYGSTRIMRVDTSLLEASNTITVSFPDGQTGGIGATVIRAAYRSSDEVEGIEVRQKNLTLYENQTSSVGLNFFPETTGDKSVTWESLDPAIATVDADGLIQGQSEGSTQIVVLTGSGGFTDTTTVSVVSQDLVSRADKSGWTVVWADDEGYNTGEVKENAIDNNPATMWHTQWQEPPQKPLPHEIWVDMGDTLSFDRFIYTPRQDPWGPNGNIGDYELFFANDTSDWGIPDVTGSFTWDIGSENYYKEVQQIVLPGQVSARFFRLVALTEHQNIPEKTMTNAAELDVASDISGLFFEEDTVRISVGETTTLSVLSLPFSGNIPGKQLNWSSEDLSIADIDEGVLKGESPGEVELIASTFDGAYRDTCIVISSVIPVEDLKLSQNELELNVGKVHILSAQILPPNAYYDSYAWSSDNEEVATVEMGYVSALKAGEVHIVVLSSDGIHRDTCKVSVTDVSYQVKIAVSDGFDGTSITGAQVNLGDQSIQTGADGVAVFNEYIQGSYELQISKDSYQIFSSTLTLPKDSLYPVQLEREQHQVDLEVLELELGIPIANVEVSLSTASGRTDASGRVNFSLPWGEHPYTLSKNYFASGSGALLVGGDTLAKLYLERLYADLKFRVSDSAGMVPGASILLEDRSEITNSLGIYTFLEQAVNSTYTYEVSKEGYETLADQVLLQKDTTLNLVLSRATGASWGIAESLEFFPNPANELLHIKAGQDLVFQLVSLKGELLLDRQLEAGDNRISLDPFPQGVYLMKFNYPEGMIVRTLSIIH